MKSFFLTVLVNDRSREDSGALLYGHRRRLDILLEHLSV